MNEGAAILVLIFLTFLPFLELRFSIPVGILATTVTIPFFGPVQGLGLSWWYVFIVCVLANILLAVFVHWFLYVVVERLLIPHSPWFKRFYTKRIEKAQKRIHKHVERWGWFGLAVFIGIPLPGSGVYTGGLAAYALGMSKQKYFLASILGVLIAGTLVTLFTLGLVEIISFF